MPLQLASAWRKAELPSNDSEEDDAEPDGHMRLARVLENVAEQAMPSVKHTIHTKFMGLTPEQSVMRDGTR